MAQNYFLHRLLPVWRVSAGVVALTAALSLFGCRLAPGQPSAAPTFGEGESLQLLLEPDADRAPVLALLNSSKTSIRMEMALLDDKEIIEALQSARARGVDVRVLLDAHPPGSPVGNTPAMDELQLASIPVKTGNPAFALTHAKIVVVDDRIALVATFDQTRVAFEHYRAFLLRDSEPEDVAEIAGTFDADWNRTMVTAARPDLVWGPRDSRRRLVGLIDTAKRTLDITAEQMRDDEVISRLTAAAKRGVTVRVLMSPVQSGEDADSAGKEKLVRGGSQLRLLMIPSIHGTAVVADETRAFVGSQDFSPKSLDAQRELGVILDEGNIVRALTIFFEEDWNIAK